MKKLFVASVLIGSFILINCSSGIKKSVAVPDGYQGTYVVDLWEGDNSIFPVNLTGLLFKRKGNTYTIMLSNINDGKAEEIEELDFTYKNGEFEIEFSSISTIKLKADKTGLAGTMTVSGKTDKLHLKKL